MRSKQLLLAVLAPFSLVIASGCSTGSVQARAAEPVGNEREIELTIYSQDFALVNEVRPVQLEQGLQRVDLRQVSKSLDPRSVMLSWASEGSDLPQLVSNAYDLGTENSASLLSRYVGQEVEVVRYGSDGDEAERIKGRLMISGSDIVLESDGKFIVNPEGTVVVPTASDVVTIPQLSVEVESPVSRAADLDLSYLSRGLSWSADYVATLLPSGDAVSLQCWATVTNNTGTSFPKAKVVLMAGSPNRAAVDGPLRRSRAIAEDSTVFGTAPAMSGNLGGAGGFQSIDPTSIGDLKAYPVAKPADVTQGQMNRLMMLESQRVPISMDYSIRMPQLSAWGYQYDYTPDKSRKPMQMAFSFKNEKSRGLGSALPAGALRVYGEGAGSKRYLGAADVPDTPTDARVDVSLSNAFDLYTTTKVLESKKLDKKTVRKTIEISVFNEKEIETKVRVVQAIYGKFKIQSESFESKKLDASNLQWTVPVPAGGKSVLKVTVDLTS